MDTEQGPEPIEKKPFFQRLLLAMQFGVKISKTSHDRQAYIAVVDSLLKEGKGSEEDAATLKNAFIAMRDTAKGNEASLIDRYLAGGVGALDLILLSFLLPITTWDRPLSLALFFLVISLPMTAFTLFLTFMKQKYQITTYGRIHSMASALATLMGAASLAASLWHASPLYGIVFSCLAFVLFFMAAGYFFMIRSALRFFELQQAKKEEEAMAQVQKQEP